MKRRGFLKLAVASIIAPSFVTVDNTIAEPFEKNLECYGVNMEDEIVKFLGAEIKWSIDRYGEDLIS